VRKVKKEQYGSSEEASSISRYLRDISQFPLITTTEEIQLAGLIKKGDKKARETMINANLRLVVRIAGDFKNRGLTTLDLINEGNIGLMKAVERFDPAFGAKLSTYATWWIKQSIRRALHNQGRTIRLPVHTSEQIIHVYHARIKLKGELGYDPTNEELAKKTGISKRKIFELGQLTRDTASLDAPLGDSSDSSTLGEIIPDENALSSVEVLLQKDKRVWLERMINKLSPREQEIIRRRFGLNGHEKHTLEEVGRSFKLTRERIRQIEAQILKKLHKIIKKN
jgi:RNA polymerase primary sigma factor